VYVLYYSPGPEARFVPLIGSNARTTYSTWMFHLSNTLQAAFRNWFYPQDLAGEDHAELVKLGSRAPIEAGWDWVDAHLRANGPWMCGESITAADFLATMLMRWSRNMPRPATTWPVLAEYVARMKARPSFRELYAREGLTEWS
jgi:glutathione S-transferase